MIFVAPQVAKPSSRCDEPVNLIDIYPTLIELCGLSKKQQLEGLSLLPQLKDPQAERNTPSLTTHERKNHSLCSKRFRYIRYADGTEELYDHDKDPREWDNLAGKPGYDQIKAAMAKYLPENDAMPVKNKK
jgi:arylsulfatase A-like enzyme